MKWKKLVNGPDRLHKTYISLQFVSLVGGKIALPISRPFPAFIILVMNSSSARHRPNVEPGPHKRTRLDPSAQHREGDIATAKKLSENLVRLERRVVSLEDAVITSDLTAQVDELKQGQDFIIPELERQTNQIEELLALKHDVEHALGGPITTEHIRFFANMFIQHQGSIAGEDQTVAVHGSRVNVSTS